MQIPDEQLRTEISEELEWDPRLDTSAVAVSATSGVITLCGTVGSFTEKSAASWDASRVKGVVRVDARLQIRLLDENRRDDADLRRSVRHALLLNSLVPASVDATVEAGRVTLTGTATTQFQRAEAEQVTARVRGVCSITNDVRIVPFGPAADDIAEAITQAMRRDARLDASNISIAVQRDTGTVRLSGTVNSWADHDEGITAAWNAPGVVTIIDDLRVVY